MKICIEVNKIELRIIYKCIFLCINYIEEWEFPTLIGFDKYCAKKLIENIILLNNKYTYKNIVFNICLEPNDIRIIYSCIRESQVQTSKTDYKLILNDDIDLVEVFSKKFRKVIDANHIDL